MVKNKDIEIISRLRNNARESLTKMSRKTGVPVSTLFDKLKCFENGLIVKHTCLIDFNKIGYNTQAKIILKVAKENKKDCGEYLNKCPNINSLFKINSGYDYLVEAVFTNIKEIEEFIEALEERFEIIEKQTFYIIEEMKRENFLSNNIQEFTFARLS